jgi:hypothetical protein
MTVERTNWTRLKMLTDSTLEELKASPFPLTVTQIHAIMERASPFLTPSHRDIKDVVMRLASRGLVEYTSDMKVKVL